MIVKRLKRAVLHTLRMTGGFRVVRDSRWRRQRLLIIGYHGISIEDEHLWDPSFFVTAERLEERFQSLARGGFNVLRLGDAMEQLVAGTLPERSVVLTFDDGLADFALNAYPLLAKYRYPATVYLSTYYTSYNRPVFGVFCAYMLWKARGRPLDSRALFPDTDAVTWNLSTEEGRRRAHDAIVRFAESRHMSGAEKDGLAQRVAAVLRLDYEALLNKRILRLLTAQEVSELSASGYVDFQLHTHRHRTPVDASLFGREIEENRAELLRLTGRVAEHFCYPSGVYRPEFFDWLSRHNVRSATTCDGGIVSPRSNPLLLPRLIDTSNLDLVEFESWTTGVGSLLPLRPHHPSH
jgi:peptidoglycan/xylan/chitin deacetylase (PgdA/CDA1 family)